MGEVSEPEVVREDLEAFWLEPAFAESRLFRLVSVPAGGRSDGALHVRARFGREHVNFRLKVEDDQGGQVTAATVRIAREILGDILGEETSPPPMGAAKPPVPPVEPEVACREVCDSYGNVQLGKLANSGGTVFRCNSNSSFSCRHQNGYLETIDWGNRGWRSADRVRIFYKTFVAPDNYAGISINGDNLGKDGSDYGCKYNSLALSCCRNVPEGCS